VARLRVVGLTWDGPVPVREVGVVLRFDEVRAEQSPADEVVAVPAW
jgi:hypothetical protein